MKPGWPVGDPAALAVAALLIGACASTEFAAPIVDRTPAPVARSPAASMPTAATAPATSPAAADKSAASAPVAAPSPPKPAPPPATPAAPAAVAAAPATVVKAPPQPELRPYREGDWRPEFHVVQKGDTLYSIALDYGQDYRDLAAWNQLADPGYIQIGQRLRLFPLGGAAEIGAPEPVPLPPASLSAKPTPAAAPKAVPLYNEPKAQRLAYSEQALAQLLGRTEKPAAAAPPPKPSPPGPPAQPEPPKTVAAGVAGLPDERLTWEWPVRAEPIYLFGKGANPKGIGIGGALGQPVVASAPGKVVYSGSGLRGYGKLIIIKHNPTYLSVYAHNSQLLVKEGQAVAQGQKIAEMGNSDSERVGLHFEIRRLGKPTDPMKYLPTDARS